MPSNAGGPCPGASALSQQYINKGPDVRCGPQASDPLSSLTPNTRILPLHVYQERRLSSDVEVPTGYRAAWTDGRLNRNRAERTVRPAVIAARADIPQGFTRADRGDDRFNPARGARTPQGDAQMAQIWTDGLPRKPVAKPLDKVPFSLREAQAVVAQSAPYGFSAPRQNSADGGDLVLRLSTRSAEASAEAAVSAAQPEPQRRRYVRAVTLANPAEAQAIARALETATGLDMRIGEVTRDGQAHQVVLSGPFTAGAEQALERVRAAGFPMARLSK
ncbi:hypothetical protein TRIHO_10130 [Tritonibacter horizontis]|uniref:Sporulation related domain protein n=1 Tax=Tritonibacter horizontis TaxID=1768241 RepID=A0A132C0M4_9RHOB|nr:hypothetical protein TRIHO_10130 [Tritonibacter horizontis]